jgi:hypothetical protein
MQHTKSPNATHLIFCLAQLRSSLLMGLPSGDPDLGGVLNTQKAQMLRI